MAGNRRANKAPRGNVSRNGTTQWFESNVERQRKRNKLSKIARRKQRSK